MKTSEAEFHFPVLGFKPENEMWGFEDIDSLTSCGPRSVKENIQLGLEIVDSDLKRWVVRSVRRTGRATSALRALADALLTGCPQSRVEYELEELTPVSFNEIVDRSCAFMEANCNDFQLEPEELATALTEIRSAKSVAQIFAAIGALDSFMSW